MPDDAADAAADATAGIAGEADETEADEFEQFERARACPASQPHRDPARGTTVARWRVSPRRPNDQRGRAGRGGDRWSRSGEARPIWPWRSPPNPGRSDAVGDRGADRRSGLAGLRARDRRRLSPDLPERLRPGERGFADAHPDAVARADRRAVTGAQPDGRESDCGADSLCGTDSLCGADSLGGTDGRDPRAVAVAVLALGILAGHGPRLRRAPP